MGQCQLARPDDRSWRRANRRGQNGGVRKVGRCRNFIAEPGNIVRDAECLADPGIVRIGPDALRIEERAERYVISEIAFQLITDLGVTLSGDCADVDADNGAVWHRIDVQAALDRADVERWTA